MLRSARAPTALEVTVRGRRWLAVLVATALFACAGDESPARSADDVPIGSGAADAPRPLHQAVSGTPAPGDSAALAATFDAPCALFGLWQPCSVLRRLESAGLGPTPYGGAVRQPGITVPGSVVRLGRGELQLFLYADSVSARVESEALDPRDAEPARTRGIRRAPAVIRSANLVALLFNNNDRQLDRVRLALTAGLPAG